MSAPSTSGRLRAAFLWLDGPRSVPAILATGAVLALFAVAGGAFGTHALRGTIDASRLATIDTAVEYQLAHGLALLLIGALHDARPRAEYGRAAACIAIGTFLFCGSLWIIGLTGLRAAGSVAPVGGLLLIAGWVLLIVGALRHER